MTPRDEFSGFTWLLPWAELDPAAAREHERALASRLSEAHPLHARQARARAARTDDVPDVLFVMSAPEELCVVSMAPSRTGSGNAPFFTRYASVQEFSQACMLPDHLEYTDDDVD